MAVITVNQIIDNIDSFIANIRKLSKSYYVFVARPAAWADDAIPPTANASVEQTELSIYREMVYGKLIANTDVTYMIRKIAWANATVYAQYSQTDPDLIDKDFYVMNDTGGVYKCIYNGGNAASTIKPALPATSDTFKTADGYIWKYMFTVDPAANTKFTTNAYIPVTPNTDVEDSAVPGTIDYITITDPGNNYFAYNTGFLLNVANNGGKVFLPNTASSANNRYTNNSIYLKAGGGAGQIRRVKEYNGSDRSVAVDQEFDVYVNLNLENVGGTISIGDTATQNAVDIAHFYDKGYFYAGNGVIQTDTGAAGVITVANSSHFTVSKNNDSNAFSLELPIYNTASAGVLKSGNVTIISGNNFVIANTGTAFTTDYASGDYINVGTSANVNIRRITSVNSTVIIVDANTPFTANLTSVIHKSVPDATVPTSATAVNKYGTVTYTNLDGVSLGISNTTPSGRAFYSGEAVKQVDEDDVDQGANGVIAFSNSSFIELTSVNGTMTQGLYVRGLSSNVKAYIDIVKSFPNITLHQPVGTFSPGQPISVRNTSAVTVGNATVVSTIVTPNMLTEYIISPRVVITGDGSNALAYAYVDTSDDNPNREISDIIMINNGMNYTEANVTIISNSQFGNGATAVATISPVAGHGSNTYMELGAKYAGISVTFANGDNESYKFPVVGEYRRVGILEDPTFNDATLTLDTFDRTKLYLGKSDGTFQPGEIAYQANTGVAGVVVYANTTNSTSGFLELKGVVGNTTFTTADGLPFFTAASDNVNTSIRGLTSGATANLVTQQVGGLSNSTVSYFRLLSNVESVSEITSGATATIAQVISNTSIRVSDIRGHFNSNDTIYDAVTNAYANVVTITIANGSIDASTDFGHKFVQTIRIPLHSNNDVSFANGEIVTQEVSDGTGTVLSFNIDQDVVVSSNAIAVINGDALTSTSGGAGIAIYSNGTYIKCTGTSGTFGIGDTLSKGNTTVGTITAVYPVLMLYNVYGIFETSSSYELSGANSGATGLTTIANTIWYPELVRDSGSVSYIENIVPFERSNTSTEKINIIIKF